MKKIAKLISERGYCSRRDAEKLILTGSVLVNNILVKNVAERFPDNVTIKINNKILNEKPKTVVFIFNKPTGCICSFKDELGRKTIFDYIPKDLPRLIYVGRLDYNSEGLILLTNNGELAKELTLPRNHIKRTYLVKVYGNIPENMDTMIKSGITIDGINYGKINIKIKSISEKKHIIEMSLFEGKNREIRRICEYFNLIVNKLQRISYENFSLNNLSIGELKQIPEEKVSILLNKYITKEQAC